jgi:hypothetical protein
MFGSPDGWRASLGKLLNAYSADCLTACWYGSANLLTVATRLAQRFAGIAWRIV